MNPSNTDYGSECETSLVLLAPDFPTRRLWRPGCRACVLCCAPGKKNPAHLKVTINESAAKDATRCDSGPA